MIDSSLDTINRKKIENDTSTNFFVEAGAGSGKTTELVARMVAMVENGVNGEDVDISKICAITFTKAAAKEFYDRFQKKLKESNSLKAQVALKNIDLCFMGTIDSFCNMLISEHPVEANVPANSTILSNEEMIDAWLAELVKIANKDKHYEDLFDKYERFVSYCGNVEQYFISALEFLLSTKNAEFQYDTFLDFNINSALQNEITDIKDAINYLSEIRADIYIPKSRNISQETKQKELYDWIDRAKSIVNKPWNDFPVIFSILKKLEGIQFPKTLNLDTYNDMPNFLRSMFEQGITDKGNLQNWKIVSAKDGGNPFHVKEYDNYLFAVAFDFITAAAPKISAYLQQEGTLSFSDNLFYLKEMLKNDIKNDGLLIQHIYSRHKYFLIDEFQDTDPIQAELFFYLSASNLEDIAKQDDINWKECIPYPGSLFIVGDPKQSIYRFRNADVCSYLNVKQLFNNPKVGEVLNLTNNFRSSKVMCDWFNDTFSNTFIETPSIQCGFDKIPTDYKKSYQGSLAGAYKHSYIDSKDNKITPQDRLVGIINEIVENPKYLIQGAQDKEGNQPKPKQITYGDIMIITYTKSEISTYMDALYENGIPFWVEGNISFSDCEALCILRAILDNVSSPDCKNAIAEMHYVAADILSKDSVFKYNTLSKRILPSSLIQIIIDDENLLKHTGTNNLEYLYFCIELIRNKEINGEIASLSDAAKFIDDLISGRIVEERCFQFVNAKNKIHLANLHKVKGLEKPVVIMTAAKKKKSDPKHHVNYMDKHPKSYIFYLEDSNRKRLSNWNYVSKQDLEEDILNAEVERLMYVAATRAGCAFIGTDFAGKRGPSSQNKAINLLDNIHQIISFEKNVKADINIDISVQKSNNEKPEITNIDDLYKAAQDCFPVKKDLETASYSIVRPSKTSDQSREYNTDKISDSQIFEDSITKISNSALLGTAVHRLMELIVNAKDFSGKYFKNFVKQVILELNLEDEKITSALYSVYSIERKFLKGLSGAAEIYCELPFCYKKNKNSFSNGIIDLLYCDGKNWHIVDYKTNYRSENLDEKYKEQLEEYKQAVFSCLNISADARIEHIALN